MTVKDLNEGIISDKFQKIKGGVKEVTNKILEILVTEAKDNKAIYNIIKKCALEKRNFTKKEVEDIKSQMKDNSKLLFIGAVGALPGSAVILPIIIKVAQKLNINLSTSKTFDH